MGSETIKIYIPLEVKNSSLVQNLNVQYLNGKKDTDFITNNSSPTLNNIKFNGFSSNDGKLKYEGGRLTYDKPNTEYIYNTVLIGNAEIYSIKELEYSKILPYENTLFLDVITALYNNNLKLSFAKDLIKILNCDNFDWNLVDNDNIITNYNELKKISDIAYCKIIESEKWDEYKLIDIKNRYINFDKTNGASYVLSVSNSDPFIIGESLNFNVIRSIYKPKEESNEYTYNSCEGEEYGWKIYEEKNNYDCIVTSIGNKKICVTTNFESKLFKCQKSFKDIQRIFNIDGVGNENTGFAFEFTLQSADDSEEYSCLAEEDISISLESDVIGNLHNHCCDGMNLHGYGIKIVDNAYLINPYIRNHIEYKKKLKLLKMIAVNTLANIAVNKTDYIVGFQKLLLTASKTDNAVELQKLLNEYVDLAKKTKIANDVMNKEK